MTDTPRDGDDAAPTSYPLPDHTTAPSAPISARRVDEENAEEEPGGAIMLDGPTGGGGGGSSSEFDTGGLPDHIALLVRPPLKSMFYAVVERLAAQHNSSRDRANVHSMMLLSGCEKGGIPTSYLKGILLNLYRLSKVKGVEDEAIFFNTTIEEACLSFQTYRASHSERDASAAETSRIVAVLAELMLERKKNEMDEDIAGVSSSSSRGRNMFSVTKVPTKVDYPTFEGLCLRCGCEWSADCNSLPDVVRHSRERLMQSIKKEKLRILPNRVPRSRSSVEPSRKHVASSDFFDEAEKAVPLSLEVTAELCGEKVQMAVDQAQSLTQAAISETNSFTSQHPRMMPTAVTKSLNAHGEVQILDARSGGAETAIAGAEQENWARGHSGPLIDTYPQEWGKHREAQLAKMTRKINTTVARYQQHLHDMTSESSCPDPTLGVEEEPLPESSAVSTKAGGQGGVGINSDMTIRITSAGQRRVTGMKPFPRQRDSTKMMKPVTVGGGISRNSKNFTMDRSTLKHTLGLLKDRRVNELRYAQRVQHEIMQVTEKSIKGERQMAENWIKDRHVSFPLAQGPESVSDIRRQEQAHEAARMQKSQNVHDCEKKQHQRVAMPVACCNIYDSVCAERSGTPVDHQPTFVTGTSLLQEGGDGRGVSPRSAQGAGTTPPSKRKKGRANAPRSYFASLTGVEGSWLDDVVQTGQTLGQPVNEAELLLLYTQEGKVTPKPFKVDCWREGNEEAERTELTANILDLLEGDDVMKHSKYPNKNSGKTESSDHVDQQRRRMARHLAVLATSTTQRPSAQEAARGITTEPPCLRDAIKEGRHEKKIGILTGEVGLARPTSSKSGFQTSVGQHGDDLPQTLLDLNDAEDLAEPLRDSEGFILPLAEELVELDRRRKEDVALRRGSQMKSWRPRGSVVGGFQMIPNRSTSQVTPPGGSSRRGSATGLTPGALPTAKHQRPSSSSTGGVKTKLSRKALDWARMLNPSDPPRTKKRAMF